MTEIDSPLKTAMGAIDTRVSFQKYLGLILCIGSGGNNVTITVGRVTNITLI